MYQIFYFFVFAVFSGFIDSCAYINIINLSDLLLSYIPLIIYYVTLFLLGFSNHSENCISSMNPASKSFSTSCFISSYILGEKLLFFCLTDFLKGSTFNVCVISLGSIPGISAAVQAKTSLFSCKNFVNFSFKGPCKEAPI